MLLYEQCPSSRTTYIRNILCKVIHNSIKVCLKKGVCQIYCFKIIVHIIPKLAKISKFNKEFNQSVERIE